MRVLNEMVIEANTAEVLKAVSVNMENHLKELEEARKGYFILVEKELKGALKRVKLGVERDTTLHFEYPRGHLDAYETAISMLKLHKEDTIKLNSTQVRSLVDDKWDWQDTFKHTNSAYIGASKSY